MYSASTDMPFHSASFEMQPTTADFDIVALNIDDVLPIDAHDDEILFKKDQQFDLASYIGVDSSSLLLSPINEAANVRQRIQISNETMHSKPNAIDLSAIPANPTIHDKVAKTPANNRRKRKNLSREFIESDDSDTDDKNPTNNCLIKNSTFNKKGKPSKDVDPVWCPPSDKRNARASKPAVVRRKANIDRKELKDLKNTNMIATPPIGQGNGLRMMLKQELLSDRPVNKTKLLKTMSTPSFGAVEKANATKVAPITVRNVGIGRGKDIAITARYYNCTESSDSSEQNKPSKIDRYHQIYTESEDSDTDIDVSGDPTPVTPKPLPVVDNEKEHTTVKVEAKKDVAESKEIKSVEKCNERVRESNVKKTTKLAEIPKKSAASSKLKSTTSSKPLIIDDSAIDSNEFAKALVTNLKVISKSKSSTSLTSKKNHLEQQKRLIKSNLLLQNPAKFKMLAVDKVKVPSNVAKLSSQMDAKPKTESNVKAKDCKIVQTQPEINKNEVICDKPIIKSEPEEKVNDKNYKVNEMQVMQSKPEEVQTEVKPDTQLIDKNRAESNAKRKLNIQEYLKRKSLKGDPNSNGNGFINDLIMNIKNEPGDGQQNGSNPQSNENNQSEHGNSSIHGNSMYEEIIIVSMGCNTDISIPEASFKQSLETKDIDSVKSSVLLSDIQTSIEKATSKISCCSLISSIQDVILKKSHSIEQNGNDEKADESPEHGENKVIMHLRKDRVRPMRSSKSIQTDPYFQFPPLQKLAPIFEKRSNSSCRGGRAHELHNFLQSDDKNRKHRNYRNRNQVSESSYYTDEEANQRPSRHSQFMEQKTVRHKRRRRESSRYSSSKYDRHRTISRSLSSSSDNSTTSTDSSTSTQSSSSSSTYISSTSARSLNSYGGSSSKSYFGDDHQYYRIRTTSNNSRHCNYHRTTSNNRSNSPGLFYRNIQYTFPGHFKCFLFLIQRNGELYTLDDLKTS